MSLAAPADKSAPLQPTSLVPGAGNGGLAIGLVYLNHWPDLPAELSGQELLVNRVCTLLSSKPRASHLIHLLLQEPKDDVHAALRGLLQSGCIRIGRASTVPGTGDTGMPPEVLSPRKTARKPRTQVPATEQPGMLGKLWSKIST